MWTGSKLSRFCAHSHVLADLNPRPTRDAAAKKGTAFHAALKDWLDFGAIPAMSDPDVTEWLQIMVDNGWAWPDGCELEVPWGLSHWGTFVPVDEPQPHVYVPKDGGEDLLTAGRADAIWMAGEVLVVIDWKTGRTPAPLARHNLQVNAAGIALAQRFKARAFIPGIYYAREGRWDMGEEVFSELLDDVVAAAHLDDKPHPGPHCSDCWERKNCEAA